MRKKQIKEKDAKNVSIKKAILNIARIKKEFKKKYRACPSCQEVIGHLDLHSGIRRYGHYMIVDKKIFVKLKSEENFLELRCPCCQYVIARDFDNAGLFFGKENSRKETPKRKSK